MIYRYIFEGHLTHETGQDSIRGKFSTNGCGKIYSGSGTITNTRPNKRYFSQDILLSGRAKTLKLRNNPLETKINIILGFSPEFDIVEVQSSNGARLTNLADEYSGIYYYRLSGHESTKCLDTNERPSKGYKAQISIKPDSPFAVPEKHGQILTNIYRLLNWCFPE